MPPLVKTLAKILLFGALLLTLVASAPALLFLRVFHDFCENPLDPIEAPGGSLAVVEMIFDCGALGAETYRKSMLVRRGWLGDTELGVLYGGEGDLPAFRYRWRDATTLEACWRWGDDAPDDVVYRLTTASSEATILYTGTCP